MEPSGHGSRGRAGGSRRRCAPERRDSSVTHGEVELQLDAYVDGELAPGDARELETHLKACVECARLHEARVALSPTIREQVPAFRAPDGLSNRVRQALRTAPEAPLAA